MFRILAQNRRSHLTKNFIENYYTTYFNYVRLTVEMIGYYVLIKEDYYSTDYYNIVVIDIRYSHLVCNV